MFKNLNIFKMAHAMAVHAGTRQAVVAENVANADTPGYRARDLPAFADMVRARDPFSRVQATRQGHLMGSAGSTPDFVVAPDTSGNPNDNAISVEEQLLKAVDAKRQHDRALAIYKSSLSILRTSMRTQ